MPWKVQDRLVYGLGEPGSGFKARRSLEAFQDYEKICRACKAQMKDFEDDEFPASDASLGDLPKGAPKITWKRPRDIAPEGHPPKFIVDGTDRFDVKQGWLGDCWLLAAAADLTLDQDFFNFVVPTEINFKRNYYGVVHFRFWQFGRWIDVVIDDRLPCKENGKLAFCSSQSSNEFWAPLLEKAFAKLNGSYAALISGLTFQGLQDLTGGVTELLMLDQLKKMGLIGDGNDMFKLMVSIKADKSFLGSAVKSDPNIKEAKMANGLIRGHAYSITGLELVKLTSGPGSIRLIRLRNPWGDKHEWTGDFCDGSKEWDDHISDEDRVRIQANFEVDGEFWMPFDDFLDNFERVEVCHNAKIPPGWTAHSFDGKWIRNSTDGGPLESHGNIANNPQFEIQLTASDKSKEMDVIVALMKNEKKCETKKSIGNITFEIFDLTSKAPKPLTPAFIQKHRAMPKEDPLGGTREVTVRYRLPVGRYCLIPCTRSPGMEGEFLLRVFTIGKSTMKVYDKVTEYEEDDDVDLIEDTPEEIERQKKYEQFFNAVADEDGLIDWWELKMILEKNFHKEFQYEGFGFSEDACRSLIAVTDLDYSGKLNFQEFVRLWQNILKFKKIFDECAVAPVGGGPKALNSQDLLKAFKRARCTISKDLLGALILRYGDKNGKIWLAKFLIAAVKLQAMLELFKRRDLEHTGKATLSCDNWMIDTMYS